MLGYANPDRMLEEMDMRHLLEWVEYLGEGGGNAADFSHARKRAGAITDPRLMKSLTDSIYLASKRHGRNP